MKVKDLLENDFGDLPAKDIGPATLSKFAAMAHEKEILSDKVNQIEALSFLGRVDKHEANKRLIPMRKRLAELNAKSHIIVGKSKILNPLAMCDHKLYAGPPFEYPDLTMTQETHLRQLNYALKENNLQPLTILFGGRKNQSYPSINFVALGADGRVAFRKYDPNAGQGQIYVYLGDEGLIIGSKFLQKPEFFIKAAFDPGYKERHGITTTLSQWAGGR